MKIERLVIYGFGRHSNVTIELVDGITVFYGKNEAGKTTIYQFILQVLFGFPPKNNQQLRYEPKSGSHYGGKVILSDERSGVVEVERIRGKSAGDVTVRFSDGTVGGQEELSEILRQYDRTAFESVFSFSLFQLQGLEQMDADELSRTLLSSGTTGIDLLMQLEKQLEKEKAELFKKSGKNPQMNVLLKELRELEDTLKVQRAKVDEYEPAVKRLEQVEQLLRENRRELQELQKGSDKLKNAQLRLPIEANRNKLAAQIDELDNTTFPPNGIREQEMLEAKKHEAEAVISRSTYQLNEIRDQLESKSQQEQSDAVEAMLVKESDWQVLQQQVVSAKADIARLKTEQHDLLGRLGATESSMKETILAVDGSVSNEQFLHKLASQVQQIERNADSYQNELQRSLELEQRTVQQLNRLEEQAPTPDEQAQALKWPSVRSRLAEAKAYVSFGKREQPQNSKTMIWMLLVIALLLSAYGVVQQQWALVIIGIVLAAVGGYGILQKAQVPSQTDEQMNEMKALLKAYEGKEELFEEVCRKTEEYTQKKKRLKLIAEEQALDRESLQEDLKGILTQKESAHKELLEALQSGGLTVSANVEIIAELFRMIRNVQNTERLLIQRGEELKQVYEKIEQHLSQAKSVLGRDVPESDLYTLIRQEARMLREAMLADNAGKERMKELTRIIQEKTLELHSFQEQEQQLFALAGADDKQSFYEAHDRYQQLQSMQLNLNGLNEQLNTFQDAEGLAGDEEQLHHLLSQVESQRRDVEQKVTDLTDERASLLHRTDALLTDDAHLLTSQLYENKKAEFNEIAFEWSSRQAAAEAIRQTMADLKDKKLPAVLERANVIFQQLTTGQYDSLSIQSDGHFHALHKDGQRFAIAELSQATKEQAYVALRLSLAGELLEQAPFPIIMDDPFVHFDAGRLSQMTELISKLAKNHQIIVFTCHETLSSHWPEAKVLNVSNVGKSPEGVAL
ncbi:ATP-binding protein [Sporosarcina aquimarina]|uniref:AAA family ATPase n=1 Tax=Sporosarcina aquimarina TaxID=114975 RepID=A0ABU4G3U9_9BACL|nr:AAA family ATPase [Sporosarcina aquimarina]MDW0111047.1 AAA family ATPase [Sporosarcina aquimarina]